MANSRYELGELIGRGGQGHTYRGTDRRSGRAVAIKEMRLSGGGGWKAFDLFERECAVLRGLSHPGIPRFLDTYADEEAGRYYLVMELVEGESLRESLSRGDTMSEAQLWNVLHQLLEILAYLHGRTPPVIHRDIKPGNVIRRSGNTYALVDFGGVRLALQPEGGSTIVGTYGYMAPEQLHGDATPATDIYSLGATLAALASGRDADKLPRRGLRVDLAEVMADTPLRRLLAKMLEPDPDERLASVDAVRAEMSAHAPRRRRQQPATPSTPSAPVPYEGDRDDVVQVLSRLIGTLGYLGIILIERIGLPFIFFLANMVAAPERRPELAARRSEVTGKLQPGKQRMKALSEGRRPPRPPRQLPPGRRDRER